MGFLKKALSGGAAKKAMDMARKPENQAKIKSMVAKARQGRGGTTPPR